MAKIYIAENGMIRNMDDVEAAENLLKKKQNNDPWAVIDDLVKLWAKKAPEEEGFMQLNVAQYRESLKDKKFGQTPHGKDQERRFKLAFPKTLMLMIRSLYKQEEFKTDQAFFDKFAKKYPYFRVAEQ